MDIKVWNLSLGSNLEIDKNFISQEGALLDKLENEYDIIFVVAGTNQKKELKQDKIGAPADSINSLVVNAIKRNGEKVSYARRGKVLSFFNKPDICYYGGDEGEELRTCIGTGQNMNKGTSFAAPWISRKMAYLIYKLRLSREIAKALIIDSATGWNLVDDKQAEYYGFGKVPIRIEDIVNSNRDEIKFYIEGLSSTYNTYTYNIPVPIVSNKYPYNARAVMCYFPKCTRNQGVDYTNTELNISFGRMWAKGVKSINKNIQDSETEGTTTEKEARDIFRKWDNVKIALDEVKGRKVPKDTFGKEMWGLKITNKGRIGSESDIRFGVVITLKEMYGKNRIDEFVNKINIENKLDIYVSAEEELEFE